MSVGAKKIMENALEAMVEREAEIAKALGELRQKISNAESERKALAKAIREQRAAIARASGQRLRPERQKDAPWEPSPESQAGKILSVIRATTADAGFATLGVICMRSQLDSGTVRPLVSKLVQHGYIVQTGRGIYKAVDDAAKRPEMP